MHFNTKTLTQNAIIACTYAVLTLAIAPLAYSEIQFRLSEVMVFLAFYNKKWIPGLVVGCFLANLTSPLGWFDLVFGTFSTFVVCLAMNYLKNRYFAAVVGAIITGVIIGFELHLAFAIPLIINMLYVAIGEMAVLLIGAFIFGCVEKNSQMNQFLK